MIDLNTTNEWQHRDPDTGLVFPWYTKSFLDELVTWDLSNKTVLEFGMGASTLWWAKKAAHVTSFEADIDWYNAVAIALVDIEGASTDQYWTETVEEIEGELIENYNIAIVDNEPIEMRDDCIKLAIGSLWPGGKLIIDNWMQPSVGWMPSEETKALLAPYPCKVYPQDGHPDWKTAVFTKA